MQLTNDQWLLQVMDEVADAVVVFSVDRDGRAARIVHVNRAYESLTDTERDDLMGSVPSFLQGPTVAQRHRLTLRDAMEHGRAVELRLEHPSPTGQRPVRLRLMPLEASARAASLFAAILEDLGPMRELEANLLTRASRDALTGLHNRHSFTEQAEAQFVSSERYQRPLAMCVLDLDHFKEVNDTWGHHTGDTVLRAVTAACQEVVRGADVLGRVGGEEFALLAPETGLPGASTLAVRLCNAVRKTRIPVPGAVISMTLSVGVAQRSAADPDVGALLARADAAMYQAKRAGRDRVVLDRG
ncbi:MAG: sensor domain-containing diguanylate cyclase [Myxococcales bacterium]|nr:sensor domain-containing diguanylate cyclase [Myxococcales bacterium]